MLLYKAVSVTLLLSILFEAIFHHSVIVSLSTVTQPNQEELKLTQNDKKKLTMWHMFRTFEVQEDLK